MVKSHKPTTISVPIYEPSPYALWGLRFDELPVACQEYLTSIQFQTTIPLSLIAQHRRLIAEEFWRSIQGVDMALVAKFIEARQLAAVPCHKHHSPEHYKTIVERDQSRVEEVVNVLLPERQRHYDRFMDKFDALLWLETWLTVNKEGISKKEEIKRRDMLCTPILEHASETLRSLGEKASFVFLARTKLSGNVGRKLIAQA
jgi:hypothetical protein